MPTFGETTMGTGDSPANVNYVQVFHYPCPEAGTVSKLTMWFTGAGTNQAYRPVIYANSAGSPGALLATGPEVVISGATPADTLIDLPLTSGLAVTAATYWLGFHSGATGNGVQWAYKSEGGGRKYKVDTYSDGTPDPFGTVDGTDAVKCTLYATYTTSAVEHFGSVTLPLTDTISVAAKKNAKGSVVVPLSFGAAVAAKKNAKGAAAVPLAANVAVAGKKNAKASVTMPLSFGINVGATILAEIVPASVSVTSVNGTGATFADAAAAGVSVTIQNEEP